MFFTPRSADTSRWRRLFGVLRSSFSRHISPASAFRHSSFFVQPTHLAGVGSSVFYALRSADISRRRRLFGILRSSFSRHISPVSAFRYLPLLVQPTYLTGVGSSVSSALRSAGISLRRRLFGILRSSFGRHIATASALRYLPFLVQPTHLTGVGFSAFFVLRSADISLRRRLFGVLRFPTLAIDLSISRSFFSVFSNFDL